LDAALALAHAPALLVQLAALGGALAAFPLGELGLAIEARLHGRVALQALAHALGLAQLSCAQLGFAAALLVEAPDAIEVDALAPDRHAAAAQEVVVGAVDPGAIAVAAEAIHGPRVGEVALVVRAHVVAAQIAGGQLARRHEPPR